MTKATVIFEEGQDDGFLQRVKVSFTFKDTATVPDMLNLFEQALRGAGFDVAHEGLSAKPSRHNCEAWRNEGLGCAVCNGRLP